MDESINRNEVKSIVLAYPHRLISEGICLILKQGGFSVLGQVDDLSELYDLVSEHGPDIILVDWEISETQIDSIKSLCENYPYTSVVVLTRPNASRGFLDALSAGAKGYLSVNLAPEDFIQSLLMLSHGTLVVAKEKIQTPEIDLPAEKSVTAGEDLSGREKEVLALVSKGETNREIAEELIISEHTVKVHLRTILNKLNLRNRQQAAAYATKVGLVKDNLSEDNNTG